MKTIYTTKVGKTWYVDIPDRQYTGAFKTKAKMLAFLKPAAASGYRVEYMEPAKTVKGYKGNPPKKWYDMINREAKEQGLSPARTKQLKMYYKLRKFGTDPNYMATWAERFRRGDEFEHSDSTGRTILKRMQKKKNPHGYGQEYDDMEVTMIGTPKRNPLYIGKKKLKAGDKVKDFRGRQWTVDDTVGEGPRHPGSTGRIHIKRGGFKQQLFPSVVGAEWRDNPPYGYGAHEDNPKRRTKTMKALPDFSKFKKAKKKAGKKRP
ncbi:MAG: hypothetical protein Q8L34_04360, partial [Candidatus Woesearchaeota archaeon]|nr:hypothetical protein [Candidatus Woesearchaeota archaeon]